MDLYIERTISNNKGTFGNVTFENDDHAVEPMGVCCEPGPDGEHPCIPVGVYDCVPHDSADHPNTYEVQNVEGRTGILLHVGNTIRDTKGCILPGMTFGILKVENPEERLPAVIGSEDAMDMLRMRIGKNNFTLTITDAT